MPPCDCQSRGHRFCHLFHQPKHASNRSLDAQSLATNWLWIPKHRAPIAWDHIEPAVEGPR